jgi:fatty acid CoA ligase FadD9
MPVDTREERLARRIADLYATDQQFADARPSQAITAAIDQPGLRLPQLVRTVMEGYADRAALGQRAVRFVNDGETGRTSVELLPRFETITYRELWDRVGAIATDLAGDPVRPGDRVCVLGFTSVDYTTVDIALIQIGAVSVPLQTSAPVAQLRPIVAETEPSVIAASVDYLDDAVELVLTAHTPARLIVFDYRSEVDDQREALVSAKARLAQADSLVIVETLADALERGRELPPARLFVPDEDDPLTLLIYTSGSTGAPKGAMQPERLVAKLWRKSASWGQQHSAEPWITLSFMPMSHLMGRGSLYGTLGKGGTAFFAAKSDLSTFLDDLALVRPTRLDYVPRIWDMLFGEFQSELDRRSFERVDRAELEATVMTELAQNLLGGRFVSALTGSAPISAEVKTFVESLLDIPLVEGYGSTEAGIVYIDGRVRRPLVIDYKLADVPDLATSTPTSRTPEASCWSNRVTCSPVITNGRRSPPRCSTRTATTAPATSWPRSVPISSRTSTAATTCRSSRKANSSPSRSWRRCSATARWSGRSTSTGTAHAPTCWRSSCPQRMHCPAAAAISRRSSRSSATR